MKSIAMTHAAAARVTPLELSPAERTIRARLGSARSGGCGPHPPGATFRAGLPAARSQQENWSRRARRIRVSQDGTSGGIAA
jgi:hypothetical protein